MRSGQSRTLGTRKWSITPFAASVVAIAEVSECGSDHVMYVTRRAGPTMNKQRVRVTYKATQIRCGWGRYIRQRRDNVSLFGFFPGMAFGMREDKRNDGRTAHGRPRVLAVFGSAIPSLIPSLFPNIHGRGYPRTNLTCGYENCFSRSFICSSIMRRSTDK